jgi:hypothetical protein
MTDHLTTPQLLKAAYARLWPKALGSCVIAAWFAALLFG